MHCVDHSAWFVVNVQLQWLLKWFRLNVSDNRLCNQILQVGIKAQGGLRKYIAKSDEEININVKRKLLVQRNDFHDLIPRVRLYILYDTRLPHTETLLSFSSTVIYLLHERYRQP